MKNVQKFLQKKHVIVFQIKHIFAIHVQMVILKTQLII